MHITTRSTLTLVITTLALGLAACNAGLAPSPTAPPPTPVVKETPITPTDTLEPTATATVVAVAPTPTIVAVGELAVEEYPIVAQQLDTPSRIEFNQRIAPQVLAKRQAWRGYTPERALAAANQVLAGFGYRLADRERNGSGWPVFDLYRGDALLQADLNILFPVSAGQSGADFAMVVEDAKGRDYLVRRAAVEPWDPAPHAFIHPVMVGDDLVVVEADAESKRFTIRRGAEAQYTYEERAISVANPLKGLSSWDGHWVLEAEGHVIVDGQDLNAEFGYDEMFAWQLLAGQPFYFYKQNGRIGLSHAGQNLPGRYEDVIHYQCCEPAFFNVAGNGTMIWFYALREGMWYYVEAGVYR